MPVIVKPIKKKNKLEDNIINFYNNKTKKDIIDNLNKNINNINKKILYFNLYKSKKTFIEDYNYSNKNKIVIIDLEYLDIDNIEQYIIKYKPKYVVINYYKLILNRQCLLIMNKKLNYILTKIDEYSKNYNVKFIVAINKEGKINDTED